MNGIAQPHHDDRKPFFFRRPSSDGNLVTSVPARSNRDAFPVARIFHLFVFVCAALTEGADHRPGAESLSEERHFEEHSTQSWIQWSTGAIAGRLWRGRGAQCSWSAVILTMNFTRHYLEKRRHIHCRSRILGQKAQILVQKSARRNGEEARGAS